MVNRIMEIKSKTAPQLGCSASGGEKSFPGGYVSVIRFGYLHVSNRSDESVTFMTVLSQFRRHGFCTDPVYRAAPRSRSELY